MSKATGRVLVHEDECKGCGLCVEACPVHGLEIESVRLNRIGYHPVKFLDSGCTGCGVCFYACPEPGALHVMRVRPTGIATHEASATETALPAGVDRGRKDPEAAATGVLDVPATAKSAASEKSIDRSALAQKVSPGDTDVPAQPTRLDPGAHRDGRPPSPKKREV